jgi:hypothetical protein
LERQEAAYLQTKIEEPQIINQSLREKMTILECKNCGYNFPSKEIELTNVDITNEYFRINWNCLK